jgi:hypothetical protein
MKIIYSDMESEETAGIHEMEIDKLNPWGGGNIHHIQILKSAAGYYIGALCQCDWGEGWEPNFRDSQRYWAEREEAESALRSGKYEVKF